jgi:hypothetical protein
MAYWIVKDVDGQSGKESMTAWASEPFQSFKELVKARKECKRINEIYAENGLRDKAYIVEIVHGELMPVEDISKREEFLSELKKLMHTYDVSIDFVNYELDDDDEYDEKMVIYHRVAGENGWDDDHECWFSMGGSIFDGDDIEV